MIKHLFPNFLEDPADYHAVEEHWEQIWRDVLVAAGNPTGWRSPWLTTQFLNGRPFLDGDPIFSAVSTIQRRAIRVLQHAPENDSIDFEIWSETFGDPSSDAPLDVLVINCALSGEAAQFAQDCMISWVLARAVELSSKRIVRT